jgi:hypothetical protein
MTPQELADLINSNQLDLRALDKDRLQILDGLQKKGVLQTEPISKIFERQNMVSEELAKQKTYEEDPIRAKTGDILNRDTVQTVFDMGFFATQLLMDRKKLASVLINPSKYSGQVGKLKNVFSKPGTNQFANALNNLDKIVKLDPNKPIQNLLRPVVAGTLGYTAGGIAYDVADDIIRAKEGIESSGYKDKLEQNPFLQAADDFATGLAWNAGAELLAPITFGAGHLVRKFLGLEGDYAKTIKKIAENNGLEASYLEMADPNSIGGKVVKAFNKVFGQLPFVGTPATKARTERYKKFVQTFENTFNLQPNMHLAELASVSDDVAQQMSNNYVRFRGISDTMYDSFRNLSKEFGDPMIFDLNFSKKYYNSLLANDFAPAEFKMMIDNDMLQTSIGRFRHSFESLLKSNRKISPNEFLELQVQLNKAVSNSPNNMELIGAYKDMKKALEKDFASVNLDPAQEILLKYPPQSANIANQILEPSAAVKTTIGEIQGARGAKLNADAIKRLRDQLHDANNFYSENIISFKTSLANRARNAFDKNLFSEKQLAGFFESGNINKDMLANMLSKNIFMSGTGKQSFDAVSDLQKLLEADVYKFNPKTQAFDFSKKGTKEGNDSLRRLFSSYLADAYQKSFKVSDTDNFLETLMGKEKQFQMQRLPGKTLDEIKQGINKQGLDTLNNPVNIGNLKFDPDEFRKLVFPTQEYKNKFNMILGPKQGKQMTDKLDELLGYVEALNSYDISNSSTFLARRLVLAGPGAVAAGGAMYGLGFPGTALMLFLANRANAIFASPKVMAKVGSTFKTYIQLLDEGIEPNLALPIMRRSIADMIGTFANEYPNDPIVFGGKDITTEELLNKLSETPIDTNPPKNINMNKEDQERLFPVVPDQDLAKVIPPPQIEDIVNIIGGAPIDLAEEKIMAQGLQTMPPGPLTSALPRLPGIESGLTQAPTVSGQIAPQDYAAAFPFDELGQLVASRRGQV